MVLPDMSVWRRSIPPEIPIAKTNRGSSGNSMHLSYNLSTQYCWQSGERTLCRKIAWRLACRGLDTWQGWCRNRTRWYMVHGRKLLDTHDIIRAHVGWMEKRTHAIELKYAVICVRSMMSVLILPRVIIEMVGPPPSGRHERIKLLRVIWLKEVHQNTSHSAVR